MRALPDGAHIGRHTLYCRVVVFDDFHLSVPLTEFVGHEFCVLCQLHADIYNFYFSPDIGAIKPRRMS